MLLNWLISKKLDSFPENKSRACERIQPVCLAGYGFPMKMRRSAEQIVGLLQQVDVELGKGQKVPEMDPTFFRMPGGGTTVA